jgi:hypothetical protein
MKLDTNTMTLNDVLNALICIEVAYFGTVSQPFYLNEKIKNRMAYLHQRKF